jgi:hypothetical protein
VSESKFEEGGRAILYAPSYDAESHVYETGKQQKEVIFII